MSSGSQAPDPTDELADLIERRGIGAPAAILLDAHRPLLPLIRQGSIFLGPLLSSVLGARRVAVLSRLLGEPESYDRLTARLSVERPDPRP